MNPRQLPFPALALLAAVACGSSSATTSATSSSPVSTCSGEYRCADGVPYVGGTLDIELQSGASGCEARAGAATASAGFLVTPQGQLVLATDHSAVGTWTLEAKGAVSFCFDSYCALCTPQSPPAATSNPKACSGAYDCPRRLPEYGESGDYTLNMQGGVCMDTFLEFTPDGKLTDSLSGRQQGTWSGDANTFQACNNTGHCSSCTLYSPTPDAGSGPTPQCTGNSDCGGCSRCASGTCVTCPIGSQGVCTC